MNDTVESVGRLRDIQVEIDELVREAAQIVETEDPQEGQRANAYWLPHIVCAVWNETEWLGKSMTTIDDSIESLEKNVSYEIED